MSTTTGLITLVVTTTHLGIAMVGTQGSGMNTTMGIIIVLIMTVAIFILWCRAILTAMPAQYRPAILIVVVTLIVVDILMDHIAVVMAVNRRAQKPSCLNVHHGGLH
ncbi:MAG: hypothetical protein KA735_13150 [Burkholderiaceae bacterium]|nr:hypothetical protein [Burkholderiaceae bacterium]